MDVYGCKDIPFHASPIDHNRIQGHQEASAQLFFQFRNASFGLVSLAFFSEFLGLGRMVIQVVFFNNSLNFPGRDRFAVLSLVENLEFLFAIPDISAAQREDAEFLLSGDLPFARSLGPATPLFERFQLIRIVPLFPEIEGFG